MTNIIIFHQSSTQEIARRMHDSLIHEWGYNHKQIVWSGANVDWKAQRDFLDQVDVALVIIGQDWLPRLRRQTPEELRALARVLKADGAPPQIIPLLVHGTLAPPEQEMPQPLRPLLNHPMLEIHDDETFAENMSALVQQLPLPTSNLADNMPATMRTTAPNYAQPYAPKSRQDSIPPWLRYTILDYFPGRSAEFALQIVSYRVGRWITAVVVLAITFVILSEVYSRLIGIGMNDVRRALRNVSQPPPTAVIVPTSTTIPSPTAIATVGDVTATAPLQANQTTVDRDPELVTQLTEAANTNPRQSLLINISEQTLPLFDAPPSCDNDSDCTRTQTGNITPLQSIQIVCRAPGNNNVWYEVEYDLFQNNVNEEPLLVTGYTYVFGTRHYAPNIETLNVPACEPDTVPGT